VVVDLQLPANRPAQKLSKEGSGLRSRLTFPPMCLAWGRVQTRCTNGFRLLLSAALLIIRPFPNLLGLRRQRFARIDSASGPLEKVVKSMTYRHVPQK
jgi:hypothetical protein